MRRAVGDDFALALYARLREKPGNLFFSPFSVRAVLAMARVGASGETAGQMDKVLGSDRAFDAAMAEVARRLSASEGGVEVSVANSLWVQEGSALRKEFVDGIGHERSGDLHQADFRGAPEGARAAINAWVEDRTRHLIRGLIPPGGLDRLTGLALVNAVHFKGMWLCSFDPEDTREEPFQLGGGATVRTPMMFASAEVPHYRARDYQAVALPYRGEDLSMLVLLPDRTDGLGALERALSGGMLEKCRKRMSLREVHLCIPRFTITWGAADLAGALAALGLTLPFDRSRADFSGINGLRPPDPEAFHLSAVLHKAFVEVNEEGTVAAAATAAMMVRSSMNPPKIPAFVADHPFLFAIVDRKSDAILFLGRVVDPS